jgi:uncharacterized membrane protein YfcA
LGYHGIKGNFNKILINKGDIKWNFCNMVFLPFGFLLAGLLSSLLGIGSGMVKAPILVELGLEPAVGAATSTFMVIIYFFKK